MVKVEDVLNFDENIIPHESNLFQAKILLIKYFKFLLFA